jgi:hypothetical protein
MSNFELSVIYDSGQSIPFQFDDASDAVQWLGGYDDGEKVKQVYIHAVTDDGRKICIKISNDDSAKASISIEEMQFKNCA